MRLPVKVTLFLYIIAFIHLMKKVINENQDSATGDIYMGNAIFCFITLKLQTCNLLLLKDSTIAWLKQCFLPFLGLFREYRDNIFLKCEQYGY
jgi:hypothetical protein